MAERSRSPATKNDKISLNPRKNYNDDNNLTLLRQSNVESTESKCGPIHIPRRPLAQNPDPSEPVRTPPNDEPTYLNDMYFKERKFGDEKVLNIAESKSEAQELVAAQKKQAEKEKDLSIKEARKWKRDSQEFPNDFYDTIADSSTNNTEQTDTFLELFLPLTGITRETSTASSTASPAARPFDDGTSFRSALLEDLKAFEALLKDDASVAPLPLFVRGVDNVNSTSFANTIRTHANLNQVAALLDSTSKKGLYHHKRKLILEDLNLTHKEIPVRAICQKPLGEKLHTLSLKGNKLSIVPDQLVVDLHGLHTLDLQQCDLTKLPSKWNLFSLRRLILSHNKLQDFLEEEALKGLPQLRHLDFYDNKLCELILPTSKNQVLTKLEYLNLGFNDLTSLPEELTLLSSLRVLKAPNNLITHVSKSIVDMELRELEVSPNPLIQPPLEDCERGIFAMRRYYRCLGTSSSPSHATEATSGLSGASDGNSTSRQIIRRSHGRKFTIKKFIPFAFSGKKAKDQLKESNCKNISLASNQLERGTSLSSASSFSDSMKTNVDASKSDYKNSSNLLSIKTFNPESDALVSLPRDLHMHFSKESQPTPFSSTAFKGGFPDEAMYDDYLMSEIMESKTPQELMAVNDTLKIIFVGMAYTGKTSLIRRLKYGSNATVPKKDERTIGVDVYEWDPAESDEHTNECRETLNTCINGEDGTIPGTSIKFSVWDFAGQDVYHATHELFFSPRALYVLVWDMGASNQLTKRPGIIFKEDPWDPFPLISSDDDEVDVSESEVRRADRALERDIDEKVQFWVDCIQSSVPGSVILPVATFDDYFDSEGGVQEARRRCNAMKRRLEQHEERRKAGITERLEYLYKTRRANTEAARRLKTLLTDIARPKLIFGGDDEMDSVIRVSSTNYRGFCELRRKIVNIACGRDLGKHKYLFGGHIGVPIPRLRLEVREVVRQKRSKHIVVEWKYFLSILRQILNEEEELRDDDVSDALQFLSTIGELSYFGRAVETSELRNGPDVEMESDDEDEDNDNILAIDDTSFSLYRHYEESNNEDNLRWESKTKVGLSGLSEYVFLNPKWLVEVVACILRHDLRQEIDETKRLLQELNDYEVTGDWKNAGRGRFLDAKTLNCPIISAEEACMLWKTKKKIYRAAERAKNEAFSGASMTTFEFLQRLLVRFSVLVPIDLSVEKAVFGGEDYGLAANRNLHEDQIRQTPCGVLEKPSYFFLPSLLGTGKPPHQIWTYKCREAYQRTLCVSWRFPDGCPPGLMERVTASVLRDIYAATRYDMNLVGQSYIRDPFQNNPAGEVVGKLRVIEILCWRTTFLITIGMPITYYPSGETRESVVEIFAHIADKDDPFCVAADSMSIGDRRLVVSAKGQDGEGGRKIWKGGFEIILKAVERVVREYSGIEFEKEGVCPDCLADFEVTKAGVWRWTQVIQACRMGGSMPRCKEGHSVDTRLVGGFCNKSRLKISNLENVHHLSSLPRHTSTESTKPVDSLLGAVVLVGLFDCSQHKILRVGSGFIADTKRGLIVTAAHILCRWDEGRKFGELYDGLRNAKAIIGIIPKESTDSGKAIFRYLAEIVETDVARMDACVVKIKTRLERDCVDDFLVPEIMLHDLKSEALEMLKVVTITPAREERVRIIGFDQGGEGLWKPGTILHRLAGISIGHVVKIFEPPEGLRQRRNVCTPLCEIVVDCVTSTIGGHSGGPCVNQNGEVVGILSRSLPAEPKRCYLVPASEFMVLVERAKKPKDSFSSLLE